MIISKEVQFDAGHRIPNHRSKCRSPHGHRYRVVVYCYGEVITIPGDSSEGMLIDFGDLKTIMEEHIHDVLDHGFIVYKDDTVMRASFDDPDWKVIIFPYIPTAENIARWCFEQLQPAIHHRFVNNLRLYEVEVWETPTSMARTFGDE